MNRAFATVIFGLAASLCWGSGDFSGGLASRRDNASSVVIAAYAVGFVLLAGLALIWREPFPPPLDILWGGLAGCGFGCFFILISRVNHVETFWPLAVARCTSVLFLLVVVRVRRQPVLPGMKAAPLVVLAGVLDAIGNAFFVLATHAGRLDVAAVLSSLYPAATVLLAMLLLRERVTRVQTLGILLALAAVPLISA